LAQVLLKATCPRFRLGMGSAVSKKNLEDDFDHTPYLPRVEQALNNSKQMKSDFQPYFDKYAKDGRLDLEGAKKVFHDAGVAITGLSFAPSLSTQAEFERFDFDGNGKLEFREACRCFRSNLAQLRDDYGPCLAEDIPVRTPEEAGYTVVKVLGVGGQGSAKLANSAKGPVCLKVYERCNENACSITELLMEMKTMQNLEKCPYIMNVVEVFQDTDNLYCVNESLSGGDFTSIRQHAQEQDIELTEEYWKPVFTQCVMGLTYMHKHGLLHCDIKEDNIMLRTTDYAHPEVVIIDFGLCVSAAGEATSGGTEGYMPPETLRTDGWSPRSDIFSMGVVFFQLLTADERQTLTGCLGSSTDGMFPNDDATKTSPFWHIIDDQYPDCKVWLKKMLAKDRLKRSTGAALLKEPWFWEDFIKAPLSRHLME